MQKCPKSIFEDGFLPGLFSQNREINTFHNGITHHGKQNSGHNNALNIGTPVNHGQNERINIYNTDNDRQKIKPGIAKKLLT